ncbi:FG-GAP repeat protein [Candidatus Woesearchaeota archaeon]|nr:FG-GAP repeat protein [Candidatus Woesearchaeota archaeon]
MNRKANTGFAVTLFAVILLIGSVMFLSDMNPSLTGASVFDPAGYVPSYCFNNSQSCINLNGDTVIDGEDESVFAQILEGDITDPAIKTMADFNGDGLVTNALDFQKCFVPLRDYYKDIEGGQAFCNLPETELNFEKCQQGCPDLDGNGIVEQDDYILFQTLLGNNTADTYYPGADMNADGYIGTRDKDCMTAFFGDIVTCNMPRYFQHTNGCPDLADKNGVGNDGYVNEYDRQLFEQYWEDDDLTIDFNGDGSITWIDRVIFLKYYEHNEVIDCNIYHAPWHVGGINKQNIKFENNKAYFGGANNLSQSFVPSYTGQLTKIRLHLRNTTANLNEVVVDVYEANSTGGPNQTYLLGSTSLVPSFELNRSSWITIPFNNPPALYENKLYHLVVSSPGSANDSYEWYYNNVSSLMVNTSNASWYGESASDVSGSSLVTGDINNDGYDDIIIAARGNDEGGTVAGKIYLIYGPISNNSGVNISNADASWYGETDNVLLGFSLATGDFNGDSYDDIIVSAPHNNNEVFVIYGKSEKYNSNMNISNISSFTRWRGPSLSEAGKGLASGDINNDGYDDLVIGAPNYNTNTGVVYIVYGPHYGDHYLTDADVNITALNTDTDFGNSVAVGDINYDGYDDIIIGANMYDSSGQTNRGAVYVFYGPLPNDDEMSILDNNAMFYGEDANDFAGYSVASGDTNNDGYSDIIIGAPGAYSDDGAVYVLLGPVEGQTSLSNADVIIRDLTNNDVELGSSVTSGDIDNDGYDDILTSAPNSSAATKRGNIYAIYGPLKDNSTFDVSSMSGTIWYGRANNALLGDYPQSISLGHVNSDEYMDILVSAPLYDSLLTDNGESYLLYSPFAINVNGSYWNQTSSSGWQGDTSKEFLFQAWLSAACADLDVDGDCDTSDEDIIKEIPDNLRYSGTPGWNERYDINGDGKIDSDDSDYYSFYASNPQTQIKKIASCESSLTTSKYFGYNRSFAQPFRADVEELNYVGLYLKLYNGSGTKDIKVEIREPGVSGPNMNTTAKATGTLEPITESTFQLYNVSFEGGFASLTANGLYYIVVSSPESPLEAEYEWKICASPASLPERRSVLILTGPNTTTFQTQTEELSFVIYEGNNDSINQTLDVNNDGSVDLTDKNLIVASYDNWSGSQWSSKVDFNAEFGVYEKLKDYILGFKAYLGKVATCSLPNWPEGRGNGRCDSAAPYYETYLTAPEDCPACNYDYFCASSEDFTYCPDCSWPAEIPHYDSFGCNTTEFFNITEISNVSNAVIEDCDYGKIELIGAANFTGLSLDNDINFSQAYLSIISPTLNALNKSANIYLYDLGYVYPWILHDGETCPASRCKFQSYTDGDLKFNVTTLGTYKEWETQTVDGNATYNVGQYSTSLDIDEYDMPHISYYDETYDNLRYAKWDGVQWLISDIDEPDNVGLFNSIKLDNKKQPHISYHNSSGEDLKYAYFNGLRWNTETIETSGSTGKYTSIALDEENYPHISYYDDTNDDLKYTYFNGSSWSTTVVESADNVGLFTSLDLNSTGHPHIIYYDVTNDRLKYAYYDGVSWQKLTIDNPAATGVGQYTSLAIDENDKLHVSYYDITNTSLKYASCSSGCNNSGNWNIETVDNSASVGKHTSIAVDSNNNPHISYYDETNTSLKQAYYNGSSWITETVDTGNVGEYTSIAVDKYNNIYISYYDNANDNLKLASYISKTEYESIEASPDIIGYNGSATTNLSINTGINLQNVSNFTIENQYGKIEFLVPVNLSPVNLQRLNLTQDINISQNNISVDTAQIPMLNVPAQISIYNLNMTYPNVLVNYTDCAEEQCEFVSFDGGTLIFNVQNFSVYSAEELAPDVSAFEPVLPVGLTTNFSINLIPDIENYSNAILKNQYGKVEFTEPANYTKLNLSRNINLSSNNFSINISALPELNVSSNIELFNLTFVYPAVYQNSTACSSCSAMSYTSGLLYFEIDGFSTIPITALYGIELAPDVSIFNSATDFRWTPSLNIENVSNVYVQNSSGARIDFLQPINATQLNLSRDIILQYRNATINTSNSTIASRLNKPAQILFYNESLTYPVIMKNGVRCRSSCTYLSRTSLAFLINVTDFNLTNETSYSLQEGAPTATLFNGTLTTNFTRPISREFDFDIDNVSNVVLEKQNLGKIAFNSPVNVSAGTLDWNNNLDIVNNGPGYGKYVFINTTMLPNLNKSANITLYNLSLVFPSVWYLNSTGDMQLCPESICKIISYPSSPQNCKTNGSCTLVFNVTDFRSIKYWAMENDTGPKFVYSLGNQVWYENRNQTITNLEGYVFDPDNETLLYNVNVNCVNITASINSTTDVLFVPAANWTGSCTASFNVSDGAKDALKNITLTVIANIPPQFINGPISLAAWNEDENKTVNLSYYFWDPDNDTLVYGYQFLSTPSNINISINQTAGVVTLMPDANWYGQNFIRFYAEDEKARTYSAPYTTLTVNSVNDIPSLDFNIPDNTKSYITIDEDTNHTIYLPNHFTDVEDNDWSLNYSLNTTPLHFNATFNSTGYVTFAPARNWNGYESFIIFARDSQGAVGQSNEFVIYVTPQPDDVHLKNASNTTAYFTWAEGTNKSFNISPWFEDDDNDAIYYYEQSPSSQIAVNLNSVTGAGIFAPSTNFVGVETINFTATDGSGSATVYATCNVTNADDDPPVLNEEILQQTWNEDQNHTINLSYYFSDPDLTALTYSVTSSPSNIAVLINNTLGTATLVPNPNWYGVSYVKFRAKDAGNHTVDSNNITLVVLSVSDFPVLSQTIPNQNWAKNTNLTLTLTNYFTDPESDPLNFTSTTPGNITVYIENTTGITTFEPDVNFVGTNNVTFTAYDPEGNNATSNMVMLTVVEGPSYLVNSYVDSVFYNGNFTNITGIVISNLTNSNITASNLYNCLVNVSTIANSNGTNCTVNNAFVRKSEFDGVLCNINGWEITSGYITFNGTTYDASFSGTENLTDLINYPPSAEFTGPSSAQPNTEVTFTDTSADYNIPSTSPGVPGEGLLNDNLTYFWDFGDGANSTAQNANHTYTSQATYTVTLTVTDNFGESDSYSDTIQIKTTPSGGGGGGGGAARCTENWNCTEWDDCTPYSIQYRTCIDINGCGTFYFRPADTQVCDYTPTCTDYVINQDESDVDCGGSCAPCVDGRICLSDADCRNSCVNGLCTTVLAPEPEEQVPARTTPPPLPPIEQPAQVSIFKKEILGVGLWVYLLAIVASGLLIAGGLFVGKQRAKKIKEMPAYSYMDSLKAAIKRDIIRGVPEDSIREALLEIGWPKYLVDQAIKEINKAMLEEPVKSDITKGYDELKLKQALVSKGWPKTTVDDVIEDVNISILRNAMKSNMNRGFTADKVGEGMINRGWPEDIVNKVIDEFKTAK